MRAQRRAALPTGCHMFSVSEYQLVDFGAGRKLERFGSYLVDRPAPGSSASALPIPPPGRRPRPATTVPRGTRATGPPPLACRPRGAFAGGNCRWN